MSKRISFFLSTLIIFFIISGVTLSGTIQLPKTGQTTSYATGDDGDIKKGVAWPSPRFADNGDETVTDNLTGLIWTKDANLITTRDPSFDNDGTAGDGRVKWQHALDYVKKLNTENYLGHSDWRLPNKEEFRSLIDYSNYNPALPTGHPFTNVQSYNYWSSSTFADDTSYTWVISILYGKAEDDKKNYYGIALWPVRAGQSGSFGNLVISVNPNSGEQGKTFNVTITGSNFTGATEVNFGSGITVNSFTVDSDTQVTANITIDSSAAAGARDVSVANADGTGTLIGGFTIPTTGQYSDKKPAISKLSKTKGKSGDVITITGKNFCSGWGEVFLGSFNAVSSKWSNNSITVTVPGMTVGKRGKTVSVKVITANGKSSKTKPFKVLQVK